MSRARTLTTIDIAALFEPAAAARDDVDRRLLAAAAADGFLWLAGFPEDMPIGGKAREDLFRIFGMPRPLFGELARNHDDPERSLRYRGTFAIKKGRASHYEGMQLGPDVVHGRAVVDRSDPLLGLTPMPPEADLPGWGRAVAAYFASMERISAAVMASLLRALGLPERSFGEAFHQGVSSLQLLHYPVRTPVAYRTVKEEDLYVSDRGRQREVVGGAHLDFGFITLVNQHGVAGLQAQMADGAWQEIPAREGHLVLNFGTLLERCSAGILRATRHRVLSTGQPRYSIAFFYEPRHDAVIAPLPLKGAVSFPPFQYKDHVWDAWPKFRRLYAETVVSA